MAAPEKDPAMVGTNNEKAKCSSRELDGQRSSGDDDLVKQEKSNLNVTTTTGTAANSTFLFDGRNLVALVNVLHAPPDESVEQGYDGTTVTGVRHYRAYE